MPNFISLVHNQIVDNFIKRGIFKHQEQSFTIYFVDLNGFINEGRLKLGNFFNNADTDYIMCASLQKMQTRMEVILLNEKGKIEGISEKLYYEHF